MNYSNTLDLYARGPRPARWQTLDTVDLDVLETRRRRVRLVAQRLLAVVLVIVIMACGVELGLARIPSHVPSMSPAKTAAPTEGGFRPTARAHVFEAIVISR